MTELIFSFDTEDFTNRKSADAILREAKLLECEGVRGCFCIVGLLARNLKKWGRSDIVEALKHHDIGVHSYGHSLHPTINEYTDVESFDDALEKVLRQETEAVDMIKDTFGDIRLCTAVPPGNQKSYAAMYAYAKLGIPIYADTFCDTPRGEGAYWCNIYQAAYTYCLESFFFEEHPSERFSNMLDDLSKRKRAVLYMHPHNSMCAEAWDILNFYKENLHSEDDYAIPEYLSEDITERFFKNMRTFIRIVKNDERFKIVTFSDIADEISSRPERVIRLESIPAIRDALRADFYPICGDDSFSLADIVLACSELLSGRTEHICKDVIGPMDFFGGVETEVVLSPEDIRGTASLFSASRPLPSKIDINGTSIGLADWLYAALDVLSGEEKIIIKPKAQMIDLSEFPSVRDCSFKGKWIQSDTFEDNYLSDRLRLQSWTFRK